jgi:nitric oxide reductase
MEEPKNDIVSQLVTEQVKKGNLDKADAVQMAFLLLVAGNATMVNMISLVSAFDLRRRGARKL